MSRNRQRGVVKTLFIVAIAILSSLGVVEIIDDDHDGRPDRVVIPLGTKVVVPTAIGVDNADKNTKPDDVLRLSPEAQQVTQTVAANPARFDMKPNVRGEDSTRIAHFDGPLATPHIPGCQTRILPTNWSERTASVRALAVHYTAGLNLPGLADMNGLTAYASSRAAGVSWHVLIDAEGHCYYSVPLGKKAWTIGNLNSQTVNIEVIGSGRESAFPSAPAGQMKLYSVSRYILRTYHLPVRLGAVSNCVVTRGGVITHWMGGVCSGGHVDIKPYSIAALVANIAAYTKYPPFTAKQRANCQELNRERRAGHGKSEKAKRLRAGLKAHHAKCINSKPGKLVRR